MKGLHLQYAEKTLIYDLEPEDPGNIDGVTMMVSWCLMDAKELHSVIWSRTMKLIHPNWIPVRQIDSCQVICINAVRAVLFLK